MSQADPKDTEISSFIALFNSALRDLRVYLRRTIRHDDDADDIAQEALSRLWGARESVQFENARPLLFRIASNLAVDRVREQSRWRFADIETSPQESADVPAERVVAAREELSAIRASIEALPENCRTAFIRSRIDGLKHAEVAREMGISKSMVEKHVAEAVYRLSLGRRNR